MISVVFSCRENLEIKLVDFLCGYGFDSKLVNKLFKMDLTQNKLVYYDYILN